MFESMMKFFKKFGKNEKESSKVAAKERLHLVLAQDRANISADFLEMMKQEIIDVIKKYVDIDEEAIDVRMTNKTGEDGIVGAPALYANIPIVTIKNDTRKLEGTIEKQTRTCSNIEVKKRKNKISNSEEEKKDGNSEIEENETKLEEKIDKNKIKIDKQEKDRAEEEKEIEDKREE